MTNRSTEGNFANTLFSGELPSQDEIKKMIKQNFLQRSISHPKENKLREEGAFFLLEEIKRRKKNNEIPEQILIAIERTRRGL